MGTLDLVLDEVESRFGLSDTKAGSLLSGLLGFINEQAGGLGGMLDRFRRGGMGDAVSSWISGDPKPISAERLEEAVGHNTIDGIASKAGLSFGAASSALAFMLPKLVQKLTPGGTVPSRLPTEVMSYATNSVDSLSSGARRAVQTTGEVMERGRPFRFLWPLMGIIALALLGIWFWNRRGVTDRVAFNSADQIRIAGQKASAALAALKPGFSSHDLVNALNLEIINFSPGSAEIPQESTDFLNSAAIALKSAPAGTVVEVGGHTDKTGDSEANLQLSQQRAEAVRDSLIRQGVDSSTLLAKGYGDTRPVADNNTEEGRFHNRRIEFTVVQ